SPSRGNKAARQSTRLSVVVTPLSSTSRVVSLSPLLRAVLFWLSRRELLQALGDDGGRCGGTVRLTSPTFVLSQSPYHWSFTPSAGFVRTPSRRGRSPPAGPQTA